MKRILATIAALILLLPALAPAQTACAPPAQAGPNFSGGYTIKAGATLPVVWTPSPTAGCTTYFTVDGSTPTSSSSVYTGQTLQLAQSTVILMLAEGAGLTSSAQVGGAWTITVTGTVTPTPPTTPALFCATDPNPACGVLLAWTPPGPPATPALAVTGYLVFRSTGAATPTQLTAAPITATTFTDATVAPSTTYDYYLTSVDAAGTQSAPSNTAQVVVAAAPSIPTPATPLNLTVSVVN